MDHFQKSLTTRGVDGLTNTQMLSAFSQSPNNSDAELSLDSTYVNYCYIDDSSIHFLSICEWDLLLVPTITLS